MFNVPFEIIFVIVAFTAFKLSVFVVLAVIFVANKSLKNPVMEFKIFEKKLVEVAFWKLASTAFKFEMVAFVIVAFPNIGLSVNM